MDKINIACVEDEIEARNLLKEYLSRLEKERNMIFDISYFPNASKFLNSFNGTFDIILMDIELPDGNGMDVIRRIRQKDQNVIVIFITNMAQYAVKGYEVRAFDFIVKPVSYFNFSKKMSLAIELFLQKQDVYIWISNKEGKMRIKASQIKYVEVIQHMLIFHTINGDIKASGSLEKIAAMLPSYQFSMCNRCYLVNLGYITAVKQKSVVIGNEELQVSRLKHSNFMHDLNCYLAGE